MGWPFIPLSITCTQFLLGVTIYSDLNYFYLSYRTHFLSGWPFPHILLTFHISYRKHVYIFLVGVTSYTYFYLTYFLSPLMYKFLKRGHNLLLFQLFFIFLSVHISCKVGHLIQFQLPFIYHSLPQTTSWLSIELLNPTSLPYNIVYL